MRVQHLLAIVPCAALAAAASSASAATLFQDNFNTAASGTSWKVNAAPTASAAQQSATFGFDYSALGIPAAPGSSDTLGLRLRANIPGTPDNPVTSRPAGTLSGLSVSPINVANGGLPYNFGTSYRVQFYAWSNFFGAANANGLADNANSEGGTNNVLFAVGTSGTVPLVVGNTGLATDGQMDGIGFATTGDGGINNDYRVYPKSGTIVPGTDTTVYPLGSNGNPAYATLFPSVSAPAVQSSIASAEYNGDASDVMAGQTQAGAFGFAWHKVVLTKNGNIVTWDVDDNRIANYDASALTLGGGNIALGQSDVNGSTARHPALLFTVFDNLVVSEVPEPASAFLIGLGLAHAGLTARRRRA